MSKYDVNEMLENGGLTLEYVTERFKELQSQNLETATMENMNLTGLKVDETNEELKLFLKKQDDCWLCQKPLTLDFGITHGESYCVYCGIESRSVHYFISEEGNKVRVDKSLQYHPNNYGLADE